MGELGWYHRRHGDSFHNQVTFSAENFLDKHGARILDHRIFKDRQCPCDPDIYYSYMEVLRVGNTRRHVLRFGILEVESNPTKESIELKREQYERTIRGVNLSILDLSLIKGDDWKDWTYLTEWIEARVPC